MFLISHRGNINGKIPEKENSPAYINEAISSGFDVEIDVWYENNNLYLGHDYPQYQIDMSFLKNDKLWCHCKSLEALSELVIHNVHCFFHESDDATLTSRGYIWTFPKKTLVKKSICVLPEIGYHGSLDICTGICSDFIWEHK